MRFVAAILFTVLVLLVPGAALAAPPEIMQDRTLWTGGDPVLTSWARDVIDDAVRYEFFMGYPQGEMEFDLYDVYWNPEYGHLYPDAKGQKVRAKILPKFEPYNTITRAEFAAILARATGFGDEDYRPGAGASILSQWFDLDRNAWYWRYLDALAGRGVIQPDDRPGREFRPNEPITRVEIATWAARAARAYGIQPPMADISQFPDADRIATVYRMDVSQAVGMGIIRGRGDGLHPYDTATRAEAAAMLMRLVRQLKKNPPGEEELLKAFGAALDAEQIFRRDNPKWKIATADWSQLAPWRTEGMRTIWYVPEPLSCTPYPYGATRIRHRIACNELDGTPSQAIGARADSNNWYGVGVPVRILEKEATDRTARITLEVLADAVHAGNIVANWPVKITGTVYMRKEGSRWKYSAPGPIRAAMADSYDRNLIMRLNGKTLADIP